MFHLAGQILPKIIHQHKKDEVPLVASATSFVGHINTGITNLIHLVASVREEPNVQTTTYLYVIRFGL